jgi:hypothetical protein
LFYRAGKYRQFVEFFDSPVITQQYACRFIDRATAYRPTEKEIDALQLLVSYRGRLVKNRVAPEVAANEMRRLIT